MIELHVSDECYAELCAFADAHGMMEGASMVEFVLGWARQQSAWTPLSEKLKLLSDARYAYLPKFHCYVNKTARKVLSVQFIEYMAPHALESTIDAENEPSSAWKFFFLEPPTAAVEEQLAAALDAEPLSSAGV